MQSLPLLSGLNTDKTAGLNTDKTVTLSGLNTDKMVTNHNTEQQLQLKMVVVDMKIANP